MQQKWMHSAYNECHCSRYTFDTFFFFLGGGGVSAPFSEVYFLKRGYQVSTMIACFPLKQSLISHVEQLQENKIQIPDSILIAMNKKKKLSCAKKQVKHYL